MSSRSNYVKLEGYLGADAEFKTTPTGRKLATARIATNDFYKMKTGAWGKTTEWHTLVFWAAMADKLRLKGKKGVKMAVEGSITYREYVDTNNVKKTFCEINVFNLTYVDEESSPKEDSMRAGDKREAVGAS